MSSAMAILCATGFHIFVYVSSQVNAVCVCVCVCVCVYRGRYRLSWRFSAGLASWRQFENIYIYIYIYIILDFFAGVRMLLTVSFFLRGFPNDQVCHTTLDCTLETIDLPALSGLGCRWTRLPGNRPPLSSHAHGLDQGSTLVWPFRSRSDASTTLPIKERR
jgi:hypothetical protein